MKVAGQTSECQAKLRNRTSTHAWQRGEEETNEEEHDSEVTDTFSYYTAPVIKVLGQSWIFQDFQE